jgi:outer membrane cobalamin receptor
MRWLISDPHLFFLGVRRDQNSIYKAVTSMRVGYVGNLGDYTLKALAGQGFQEPVLRMLFGSWKGSGSNATLRPETSRTVELSGAYTSDEKSWNVSLWSVRNRDTVVAALPASMNLGERSLAGLDLQGELRFHADTLSLRTWGFYSRILHYTGSNNPDATGAISQEGLSRDGHVGDLAVDQLGLGITAHAPGWGTATLLGRYVGPRDTVATNPLGRVSGFATLDLNVRATDLFSVKGLDFSLRVSNLLDRTYFHPGVSQADAGTTPGYFDASGTWHGSTGWYSSLLPQPGRTLTLAVRMAY